MGSDLSILLVEDTEDTGSDHVVDDGLVVSANDVNTKLLIKCGVLCSWVISKVGGRDL